MIVLFACVSFSFVCHIKRRQTQIISVQTNFVELVLVLAQQTAVIIAVCDCFACVWSAVLFKLQHFMKMYDLSKSADNGMLHL